MARIVSSGPFSGSTPGLGGPSDMNRTESPPEMASISALRLSVDANQMSPMPRAASSPAILIKRLMWPQLGLLANRMRRPLFTSAAAPTGVLLGRPQPRSPLFGRQARAIQNRQTPSSLAANPDPHRAAPSASPCVGL